MPWSHNQGLEQDKGNISRKILVWKDFKHTPRWNGDVWECYKRACKTFKWIPILKAQSPWVFQKFGSRSFGPKSIQIELSLTIQKVLKKTTIVEFHFGEKKIHCTSIWQFERLRMKLLKWFWTAMKWKFED